MSESVEAIKLLLDERSIIEMKSILKRFFPTAVYDVFRFLRRWRDFPFIASFLFDRTLHASFRKRFDIVRRAYLISFRVPCPHTQEEVLSFVRTVLSLSEETQGVVVEAGCFKGGSTAKFSIAAELAGRKLIVFDSFRGIPKNEEFAEKNIFGGPARFKEGTFCGSLEEVKANVTKYGKIDSCRFIEGWFDDTMPSFDEPVAAAYIDVDLSSSTKACLRYLFPRLQPGGVLYSQDGHLPFVISVFDDEDFWLSEVGCRKPRMVGLGTSKLIKVIKDAKIGRSKSSL